MGAFKEKWDKFWEMFAFMLGLCFMAFIVYFIYTIIVFAFSDKTENTAAGGSGSEKAQKEKPPLVTKEMLKQFVVDVFMIKQEYAWCLGKETINWTELEEQQFINILLLNGLSDREIKLGIFGGLRAANAAYPRKKPPRSECLKIKDTYEYAMGEIRKNKPLNAGF
jgi:hypothetical protein